MKIPTVNVIEMVGGNLHSLTAFSDTPEGNKEAEKHFIKLLKEYNAEPEDIEQYVIRGRYEGAMNYEVFIIRSNTTP